MYDVFFISYDESNADSNWQSLKARIPYARRLHGIKGISNAHKTCAARSYTEMFYTVDGDTLVDDSFAFAYKPPEWDKGYLHLWHSRNPANVLIYGYGAIKLWPRGKLLSFSGNWLDFATTVGDIKIVDDVVATTVFNSDPYNAWKSAFRETIKLCHNVSKGDLVDSLDRLAVWVNPGNPVDNSDMVLKGARSALAFFMETKGSMRHISVINDFDWLRSRYQTEDISDTHVGEMTKDQLVKELIETRCMT